MPRVPRSHVWQLLTCVFIFCALALGQDTALFTTIVNTPVGSAPLAGVITDLDENGIPDMVVANSGQNSLSVLLGNGDGNFLFLGNYPVGIYPAALATGDFNHDGHVDVAVVESNPNTNGVGGTLRVIPGKGNGDLLLSSATTYGVGVVPTALAVGDFDGDGNLDIAVVVSNPNLLLNPGWVTIFSGKGDGTFVAGANYSVGADPASITVGDFNGDGKPDLAVGSPIASFFNTQSEVSVLLNNGSGAFQNSSSFIVGPLGSIPLSIAAADLNNDGILDLAIAVDGSNNLLISRGNGDGSFTPVSSPLVGSDPFWVAAADLNGDGKTDLVSANHGASTISVLQGNGDETFTTLATYKVGTSPANVALNDLNGDGLTDVAVVNNADNTVQVLLGENGGTFRAGSFKLSASSVGITTADFNEDGFPDIAVLNGDFSVSVLLADGRGGFNALPSFAVSPCSVAQAPNPIVAGDFDGDGKIDLAVACDATTSLRGNGDGTFTPGPTANIGTIGLGVADIDGDGVSEAVISNGTLLFAFNLLGLEAPIGPGDGQIVTSISPWDFNGDGKVDLLLTNISGGPSFSGLLGNGTETFQTFNFPEVGTEAIPGDFNGDGLSDFVYEIPNTFVTTALSNGDGTMHDASTRGVFAQTLLGSVADINGDGIPDVVEFNEISVGVLLGAGDGNFSSEIFGPYGRPSANERSVIGDFDQNGSPDAAVLDLASGTVSILLNNRSWQTTTTSLVSSPVSVVAGQPITLSATVANPQNTPDGVVVFKQSGVPQTTIALTGGAAQTTLNAPTSAGQYGYTALYTGDDTFGGSLSPRVVVNVTLASTTTVVTSTAGSSKLGQNVTFTATVVPQFSGQPSGTVEFYADGQPLGSVPLSAGLAMFTTAALTQGSHTIEADYSGDSGFVTSLGTIKQNVGRGASTVSLTSSLNPSTYGQSVSLTATVSDSGGGTPTGVVVFVEGPTVYGSVPLNGGVAQITLSSLSVGKHLIAAQYSGDSSNGPAQAKISQVVNGALSTTTITSSVQPSVYGQDVIFTALVASDSGTPDGTITFKSGALALGTVNLSGGQALLTVNTLNVGTHTITALYSGSSIYGRSSGSIAQIVERAATATSLTSSINPVPSGQTVTFTALVTAGGGLIPAGNVTFKDGRTVLGNIALVNGQAQFNTSSLATGSHTITAVFSNSGNFAGSQGTLSQVVQ